MSLLNDVRAENLKGQPIKDPIKWIKLTARPEISFVLDEEGVDVGLLKVDYGNPLYATEKQWSEIQEFQSYVPEILPHQTAGLTSDEIRARTPNLTRLLKNGTMKSYNLHVENPETNTSDTTTYTRVVVAFQVSRLIEHRPYHDNLVKLLSIFARAYNFYSRKFGANKRYQDWTNQKYRGILQKLED